LQGRWQWRENLKSPAANEERIKQSIKETVDYYERELAAFRDRWLDNKPGGTGYERS
jgi:hypothetical protein